MIHRRGARRGAGILLGVAAGVSLTVWASAPGANAAASTSPNTPTQVPSGINAATLPGASVFGTTPTDTPETVSFVLKERNIQSLEGQVEALRRQGSHVEVITPDADSRAAMGTNQMDPATRIPAARAGFTQGKQEATRLAFL